MKAKNNVNKVAERLAEGINRQRLKDIIQLAQLHASIQNQIMLDHIISQLYTTKEYIKIQQGLNKEADTLYTQLVIEIADRRKNQPKR